MSRNARGKEIPDHLAEIAARVNRLIADPNLLEKWRALYAEWLATLRPTAEEREKEREREAALQEALDRAKSEKEELASHDAYPEPEQRRRRLADLADLPPMANRMEKAAVLALVHDAAYDGDEIAPQLCSRSVLLRCYKEDEGGWAHAMMRVLALPAWTAEKAIRLAEYLADVEADLSGGKAGNKWGNGDDPDAPLSPAKLADRLGITKSDAKAREKLRKRLESWRKANLDGGWIEAMNPKPRWRIAWWRPDSHPAEWRRRPRRRHSAGHGQQSATPTANAGRAAG
jgi:hypothetical protein